MKVRSCFVSNSSSSSFVIAAKPNIKLKVRIDVELDPETILTTIEELDDYFLREYGYGEKTNLKQILEEDDYAEMYETYRKHILKNKHIYIGSVSNESDNPTEMVLYDQGISDRLLNKDSEVLQDCA